MKIWKILNKRLSEGKSHLVTSQNFHQSSGGQEKSISKTKYIPLIYRHICLMNHLKTHQAYLMAPWDPMQCPAVRVFQYRVGSGINYRVKKCDWVFRVSILLSGISGYFGYVGYFWVYPCILGLFYNI